MDTLVNRIAVTMTLCKPECNYMIGTRIRELRERSGLSLEALAELTRVNKGQIWRYEAGKNMPGADILGEIARALNTTTDYLVGLTDDPIPIGIGSDGLNRQERAIVAALRRGQPMEAVKIIVESPQNAEI